MSSKRYEIFQFMGERYEVFQFMGDTWAWNEVNEVFLKQDMNWVYQFNFECDDPEALVLLKAYIRSKHYATWGQQ